MTNLTAREHVAWAKHRALLELDAPGRSAPQAISAALASMASDLNKHASTADHPGLDLGIRQIMAGLIETKAEMRRHIEGYN